MTLLQLAALLLLAVGPCYGSTSTVSVGLWARGLDMGKLWSLRCIGSTDPCPTLLT